MLSWDKDYHVDVWIVKMTTETKQMRMAFASLGKQTEYKNHVCPLSPAF